MDEAPGPIALLPVAADATGGAADTLDAAAAFAGSAEDREADPADELAAADADDLAELALAGSAAGAVGGTALLPVAPGLAGAPLGDAVVAPDPAESEGLVEGGIALLPVEPGLAGADGCGDALSPGRSAGRLPSSFDAVTRAPPLARRRSALAERHAPDLAS